MKKLLILALATISFNCFAETSTTDCNEYGCTTRSSNQVCTTSCSEYGCTTQCS